MPVLVSLVLFLVNQNVCRRRFNQLCKIIRTLAVFHSFGFLLLFYVGDEGVQLETKSGKALGVLLNVSL